MNADERYRVVCADGTVTDGSLGLARWTLDEALENARDCDAEAAETCRLAPHRVEQLVDGKWREVRRAANPQDGDR